MAFKDSQVMVVCDPNASLAPNLRARYSARIEGFDDNRVLQGVGSGDEMLPNVLSHLTLDRVRIDVPKKRTKLKADRLEEAAAAE